jgi:ribosome recycling factor
MVDSIEVKKLKDEILVKLKKSIEAFEKDVSSLRTGRASANMLDAIRVEYFGNNVPLDQVATISTPEPRMIMVNVWDKSSIVSVENAIRNSNLGINPLVDGTKIKLPIPPLTEERRKELVKKASEYAEKAKVAIRQVRKLFLDDLKAIQKNKLISEDDFNRESESFEKIVKLTITEIDNILSAKSKDMMQL